MIDKKRGCVVRNNIIKYNYLLNVTFNTISQLLLSNFLDFLKNKYFSFNKITFYILNILNLFLTLHIIYHNKNK